MPPLELLELPVEPPEVLMPPVEPPELLMPPVEPVVPPVVEPPMPPMPVESPEPLVPPVVPMVPLVPIEPLEPVEPVLRLPLRLLDVPLEERPVECEPPLVLEPLLAPWGSVVEPPIVEPVADPPVEPVLCEVLACAKADKGSAATQIAASIDIFFIENILSWSENTCLECHGYTHGDDDEILSFIRSSTEPSF